MENYLFYGMIIITVTANSVMRNDKTDLKFIFLNNIHMYGP